MFLRKGEAAAAKAAPAGAGQVPDDEAGAGSVGTTWNGEEA